MRNSPTTNSKDKEALLYERFQVDFKVYTDKTLYAEDLQHHIWPIGEKVKVNGIYNTIISHNLHHATGLLHYELVTEEGHRFWVDEIQIEDLLETPLEEYFKGNKGTSDRFLLRLWAHQLHALYESNSLKIVSNSRLSLQSHQIAVAHHLLQCNPARYILADEVGLGKTIEAGIYIKEMLARKLASRILLVVPASLTSQWEFEMENKFNLIFRRLTSKIVKKLQINYRTGNFQHEDTGEDIALGIISMQYARLPRCAKVLTQLEWDIVIFDEAHHLRRYLSNQKSERYRTTLAYELAEKLAQKTRNLLLLTATPIQLHSFDLFSLIQLLNPFEFPNFDAFEVARKQISLLNLAVNNLQNFTRINSYERSALPHQILTFNIKTTESQIERNIRFKTWRAEIISQLEEQHFLSRFVIRNRRRVVFPDRKIRRRPQVIEVVLTQEESLIYNKIHLYLAKIYSQNFETGPAGMGFVMVILQKLLTSSVPAVLKTMKKRIAYLHENRDMLEKLGMEQELSREFTAEDSSLDVSWGLETFDLEDRLVFHTRKKAMIEKKNKPVLKIADHIHIMQEFVQDLEGLTIDSKAAKLLSIIDEIMQKDPLEKILIFTQFKQTLFYIDRLLQEKGYAVAQFHGDLNEAQKNASVSKFRYEVPILLSTEIGGEGRNFQFAHIIMNYDLPWNPMRLEQRIGRLDRYGQTQDILIYNFFIQDTVEASIISAITERIHLFEESIGALEPILGFVEKQITNLVLKENEEPIKFRLDELMSKTTQKIDEVYDKLDDFILDKRSFQYDYLSEEIDRPSLLTGIDLQKFCEIFTRFSQHADFHQTHPNSTMEMNLAHKHHVKGIWVINMTEGLRKLLRVSKRQYEGMFDLELAQKQEDYDFFALGHPLISAMIDFCLHESFEGFSTDLPLNLQKWTGFFLSPYGVRLSKPEIPILQRVLLKQTGLNLFVFSIDFLGVIVEKVIVPILITNDAELLPTLANYLLRFHNLTEILHLDGSQKESNVIIGNSVEGGRSPREILEKCYAVSQQATKTWIKHKASELIDLNKKRYTEEKTKFIKNMEVRRKYVITQLKSAEYLLRAKKLKLPTERQRENVNQLSDSLKKARRLKDFKKREDTVLYYQNEIVRWEQMLETLEFDLPARLARLKKYRKLLINATFLGFARVICFDF
jgi:superfamily II DNA or RNA helicase